MTPAVNQIEVHPYFRQAAVLAANAERGILSQAWSPIGGITFYRDGSKGSTLEDPTIVEIATAHGRTPAQVMLRWHLQQGRQVIPKSVTPSRIAENIDVFDFDLTAGPARRHRRPRHRHPRRPRARDHHPRDVRARDPRSLSPTRQERADMQIDPRPPTTKNPPAQFTGDVWLDPIARPRDRGAADVRRQGRFAPGRPHCLALPRPRSDAAHHQRRGVGPVTRPAEAGRLPRPDAATARPARNTGTAPRPTPSWSISP